MAASFHVAATNLRIVSLQKLASCGMNGHLKFLENVAICLPHILQLVVVGAGNVPRWSEHDLVEAPEGQDQEQCVAHPVDDL